MHRRTRRAFVSFLLPVWLLFASPGAAGGIDVVYSGSDHGVGLILRSEHLRRDLQIGARAGGEIFFETAAGRVRLTGKPLLEEKTADSYRGVWQAEAERSVTVSIQPAGRHYVLSLTVEPDAGILKWGFGVSASEDEYFTGVFERVVDGNQEQSWRPGVSAAMDLRGQRIDMLVKPTLSLYLPFYLSSAGYGLLVEGTWPGHYDFGASDPALVRVEFEGPALHARIWTGPDPAAIVMANARHVGPPVLPPQWAFTPWRWRDAHENKPAYYDGTPAGAPYNSQVVEDVLLMKYFDIPNGVYWIDRPWAKGPLGYDDFDWDPVRMPAARSMIEWIHERGMRLLVWIAPWLTGDLADQAVEQGYALAGQHKGIFRWEHQDAGSLLRIVKRLARRELPGDRDRILVDFTRPGAVGWWQTHTIRKLLEQGVDGFKLDRGEEIVPESRATLAWDGRTARELRNDYPRLYLKAVYDGAHQQRGNDFAAIARAAYTGSSRYGIFWGGDIAATPEGLRAAIVALQRAAVMGYPFWGSDTGGYWQGDPDREVLARWLAFSCFTPIFEVGPTENRGLWDLRTEPAYDIELIAIWRLYAHLHNDLADYTYRHARLARETGMPVVRPLFLEFPEQEQAWREWQGFLYGEDLLVSPVWRKGKTQHEIYLPAGVNWTSAWDGKEYEGGQTISIPTPLYKIPIFLRAGSKLALRDLERTYREGLQIAAQRPDMKALEEAAFGVSN